MYSQLFKLRITNPENKAERNYIIDYNGNETEEEIKAELITFICRNRSFYTDDVLRECLNEMSGIYYLDDLEEISIPIPKTVMDIEKL